MDLLNKKSEIRTAFLRTPDDKLRWAFKMYDEDNSREIDLQEMERVMLVRGTNTQTKVNTRLKASRNCAGLLEKLL